MTWKRGSYKWNYKNRAFFSTRSQFTHKCDRLILNDSLPEYYSRETGAVDTQRATVLCSMPSPATQTIEGAVLK
jgi:hypothetical protein